MDDADRRRCASSMFLSASPVPFVVEYVRLLKSRCFSFWSIHRTMSISVGRMIKCQPLKIYRGAMASKKVRGRQSQK
jgi:hypothetical protein